MSPVIFPQGFTRDFLDGKISSESLIQKIKGSHDTLMKQSEFVVCEGTGHTGVGSICEVNNAQVASALGMDAICVALGGLGSSFDQLALNREMLEKHGVKLRGVILNKVNPEKMDMISVRCVSAIEKILKLYVLGLFFQSTQSLGCKANWLYSSGTQDGMTDIGSIHESNFLARCAESSFHFRF